MDRGNFGNNPRTPYRGRMMYPPLNQRMPSPGPRHISPHSGMDQRFGPNFSPRGMFSPPHPHGSPDRYSYTNHMSHKSFHSGRRFTSPQNSFDNSYHRKKNDSFDRGGGGGECNPGGSDNIAMYYQPNMTMDPWQNLTPVPASPQR